MENTNTFELQLEKPEIRKELPKNPVSYLRETYPPRINGAGLEMSSNIEYITEEIGFLENEAVENCIEDKGLEALGLLWFLRLMMANDLGWGMDITDKKYKKLCDNLSTDFNISKNKVEKLLTKLIQHEILLVVEEEGKKYYTTYQQFYNYEYKCWYRLKNNASARKYYLQKKEKMENATNPIENKKEEIKTIQQEISYSDISNVEIQADMVSTKEVFEEIFGTEEEQF